MSTLKQSVDELNALIKDFKFHEALDKFYDEGIVNHENENPPIVGLKAYREAAKDYLGSISNQKAELKSVIISDDISVTEWRYTFDHKKWGKWDAVQISVQRWKNGKIVHERHHYKTGDQ